jgi:S-methylmethionine-dependent homocysteine/selenocysteine methylase
MPKITILDGGMGRELQRVGAPFRQPEWSALPLIESPQHVTQVHENYVEAGADVITTNAYAIVPFHIGDDRFRQQGRELAALAGKLARDVANRHPGVRVAGCIPPVLGSYLPDRFVADEARPLVEVLVEEQAASVDLWLAETQSSIAEVELIAHVLRDEATAKPLWCSFTLDDQLEAGEARLRSGESIVRAVRAVEELGAEAVSFNCSQPEVMEAAIAEAVPLTTLPVGVYANAFVLESNSGQANEGLSDVRDDVTPDAYVELAKRWVAAGATIVGGCCGVGPEHIRALSAQLANS